MEVDDLAILDEAMSAIKEELLKDLAENVYASSRSTDYQLETSE